jgi:5-methylcytosine-specific restriction endonuclease McrA
MRGRYPKFCAVCKSDKAKLKAHYYLNSKAGVAEAYAAKKPIKFCVCCGLHPVKKHSGKYCSNQCESNAHQAGYARKDARKRNASAVESVVPATVFERDKWLCYICGDLAPPEFRGSVNPLSPEIDHVTPLHLGGNHDYANVKTAHRKCNAAKGGLLFSDLILLAQKIACLHSSE